MQFLSIEEAKDNLTRVEQIFGNQRRQESFGCPGIMALYQCPRPMLGSILMEPELRSTQTTAVHLLPSRPFTSHAAQMHIVDQAISTAESFCMGVMASLKEWYTTNSTHCKTGYLVIQDTDCYPAPQHKYPKEPGQLHGAIYRNVFGESCVRRNVVGEGFGVENGNIIFISGVFNATNDDYHDENRIMNPKVKKCIRTLVLAWMTKGRNCPQNYDVKNLLEFELCPIC